MKYSFYIFLLSSIVSFSQNKENLVKSLSGFSSYQSDCVRQNCKEFQEFFKVYEKTDGKEIRELLEKEKPIIRAYVENRLIVGGKADVVGLFEKELKNQDSIEFSFCLYSITIPLSNFVYNQYIEAIYDKEILKRGLENKFILNYDITIKDDSIVRKLDSVIIFGNYKIDYDLYSQAFKNRTYPVNYIKRINELALDNNAFAFKYLVENKENTFDVDLYFHNQFQNAEFKTYNELMHLREYLEYLLKSKSDENRKIAIEKIIKEKEHWSVYPRQFKQLIDEFDIKI